MLVRNFANFVDRVRLTGFVDIVISSTRLTGLGCRICWLRFANGVDWSRLTGIQLKVYSTGSDRIRLLGRSRLIQSTGSTGVG